MQKPQRNLETILSLSTDRVWKDLGLLNLFLFFKNQKKEKKKERTL